MEHTRPEPNVIEHCTREQAVNFLVHRLYDNDTALRSCLSRDEVFSVQSSKSLPPCVPQACSMLQAFESFRIWHAAFCTNLLECAQHNQCMGLVRSMLLCSSILCKKSHVPERNQRGGASAGAASRFCRCLGPWSIAPRAVERFCLNASASSQQVEVKVT